MPRSRPIPTGRTLTVDLRSAVRALENVKALLDTGSVHLAADALDQVADRFMVMADEQQAALDANGPLDAVKAAVDPAPPADG